MSRRRIPIEATHVTVPERFIRAIARATIDRHGIEASSVAARRADQRRRR